MRAVLGMVVVVLNLIIKNNIVRKLNNYFHHEEHHVGHGRGNGKGLHHHSHHGNGNGGGGFGPSGQCICLKCGHKQDHQSGIKCTKLKCPECGHVLARKELVDQKRNKKK